MIQKIESLLEKNGASFFLKSENDVITLPLRETNFISKSSFFVYPLQDTHVNHINSFEKPIFNAIKNQFRDIKRITPTYYTDNYWYFPIIFITEPYLKSMGPNVCHEICFLHGIYFYPEKIIAQNAYTGKNIFCITVEDLKENSMLYQ